MSNRQVIIIFKKWLSKQARHEKGWADWPIASGRYEAYRYSLKEINRLLRLTKRK